MQNAVYWKNSVNEDECIQHLFNKAMEEVEGVKQCEQEALLNFHKQSAGLDGQARHNFLSKYLNWNNRYSVYLNPLKSELQLLFHSIRAHKKLYQKLQKSNA